MNGKCVAGRKLSGMTKAPADVYGPLWIEGQSVAVVGKYQCLLKCAVII